MLNDRTSGKRAGTPEISIYQPEALRTSSAVCHIAKNICGNPNCNRLKRKSLVTSVTVGKQPPFSWRSAYQKLGSSIRKYHARTSSWQAPSIRAGLAQHCLFAPLWLRTTSLYTNAAQGPEQVSPKELSDEVGGQPTITRNTSRTKRAIAMSLKSVAWGRSGQNWLAAQKRKADSQQDRLQEFHCSRPMRNLVDEIGKSDHGQRKRRKNLVTSCWKQSRKRVRAQQDGDGGKRDDPENDRNQSFASDKTRVHS